MGSWRERKPSKPARAGSAPGSSESGGKAADGGRAAQGPSRPSSAPEGWRKAAAPTGPRRHWQERRQVQGLSPEAIRRLKLTGTLCLLAFLIAVFIIWLDFRPRRVPIVALMVTQYAPPLDPNALVLEDRQRFEKAYGGYRNVEFHAAEVDVDWQRSLNSQLHRVGSGGPGKGRIFGFFPDNRVVILYISAHGAVDSQGRPCLLTAQSRPEDEATWVRVADLLGYLGQHERLEGKHVLLMLDAGRIRENWRVGILHNGFAELLPQAVREAGLADFYVLNATRGDQKAWTAPELGGSVFGYFSAAGLRGAADTDGDGRIGLVEFHRYLLARVDNFVYRNRTARQQPILLSASGPIDQDEGLDLAYASGYTPLDAKPVVPSAERVAELDRLWADFENEVALGVYRRAPMPAAAIQNTLARMESLLLAGSAYADQFQQGVELVKQRLAECRQPLPVGESLASGSVWLLEGLGVWRTDQMDDVHSAWDQWRSEQKEASSGASPPPPAVPYLPAAAALWQELLAGGTPLTESALREALARVPPPDEPTGTACREMHELEMLADGLDWQGLGTHAPELLKRYLGLEELAERLASAPDPRTHYWIRGAMDEADRQMRAARDRLFIGSAEALRQALSQWEGCRQRLDAIERTRQIIADAYAVRDQMWAELPHLMVWLMECPDVPSRTDRLNQCLALVSEVRQLARQLAAAPAGVVDPEDVEEIEKRTQTIAASSNELHGVLRKTSGDLLVAEAGMVRRTLHRIAATLESPLVIPERKQLRAKLLENLATSVDVQDRGTSMAPQQEVEADPLLGWLAGLDAHPALTAVDASWHPKAVDAEVVPAQRSTVDGERLSDEQRKQAWYRQLGHVGGQVRSRLAAIDGLVKELIRQTEAALASSEPAAPAAARQGLDAADSIVRSAAALLGRRPWASSVEDPSWQLRLADAQFLLLWHADRTLEDFWGPAGGTRVAYFDAAASQLVKAAGELYSHARTHRETVAQKLFALRDALKQWKPLSPSNLTLLPEQRTVNQELAWSTANGLPAGEAAVFLQVPGSNLLPVKDTRTGADVRRRQASVNAPSGASSLVHLLTVDPSVKKGVYLDAVTFYRGHRLPARFAVGEDIPAATVVYHKPPPAQTTVQVRGVATQKIQLIFILDCSYSMRYTVPSTEGRSETRLVVARRALKEVLERLDDNAYAVGLVLYGHRANFKQKRDERGGWEIDYSPIAPPDLSINPAEDVEPAVPVTPLADNPGIRHEIALKLDRLAPFGQTPLYLAICKAVGYFSDDHQGPRHVIVITDGVNEQDAGGYPVQQGVIKIATDVHTALRNAPRPVHVDIIGFGLENETNKQGLADLRNIATQSGGRFHEARDPSSLLERLRDSLRLARFYVHREGQPEPPPEQQLELNEYWNIPNQQLPANFFARISGRASASAAPLHLHGGEGIVLLLDAQRGLLQHDRFKDNIRRVAEQVRDPRDPRSTYFVGTHLPQSGGGGEVHFPVSIQNAVAERFSPRPSEVWAELRPLPSREPVYYIYDPEWIPRMPVPVLRLRAAQWPHNMQQAELRLWFTFSPTTRGVHALPLDLSKPQEETVEGVRLEIEPSPGTAGEFYRIVVIEQHPDNSTIYPLRVQLRPPPDEISHGYSPEKKQVRHVFAYRDREFMRLETPRLLVTALKERGALDDWAVTPPLVIDLSTDRR